jgi:hypothetical protein
VVTVTIGFQFFRPPGRAEVFIPQFAGHAIVFTPPVTPPRRSSTPETTESQVQFTPSTEGFAPVEFKLQGPFGDAKPVDTAKQAALNRLDELTRILIDSEENYVGELKSIVEVWNLGKGMRAL